jgi:hypothetical protein
MITIIILTQLLRLANRFDGPNSGNNVVKYPINESNSKELKST